MAEKIDNLQEDVVPEGLSIEQLREKIGAEPEEETTSQAEDQVPVTEEEQTTPSDTATEDKVEVKTEPIEDLILGKFKTQDDLAKAYEEIEKKSTRDAQLRSQYKDTLSPYYEFDDDGNISSLKEDVNINTVKDTQPVGETQADPLAKWENYYNALEQQHGPVRAQIILNATIQKKMIAEAMTPVDNLKADREIERQKNEIRASGTDISPFEVDMDKILAKMDSQSKSNKSAVRTVLSLVKGQRYDEYTKEQKAEVSAKAVEIEKQKEKAQVQHQTKTPEEPAVDLDNLSAADFKKQTGLKRESRY